MSKAVASMTGYARTMGAAQGCNFQCELKSVNGRGLDVKLRLANGLDAIEGDARRTLSKYLSRGSVTLNVTLAREHGGAEIGVNEQALGAVLDALDTLAGRIETDRPRLDGILNLKGVLEARETQLSEDAERQLHKSILESVETCAEALVRVRSEEGTELKSVVIRSIDEIERLTKSAVEHPSRKREVFVERIRKQINDLKEASAGFSEERLHQEALLLATKADIQEELDRLQAHVVAARKLLDEGGPIGRKLDFLAQEFNREANTLCSKSHAVELTAIGLDLKAVIDQLREQVQNLE
ncbi:MAG: YicC family protein [Hyphomicrobiaceae bacterium]|nr:YicC family protein [Hyphomicrobiaceae bacterium]MCC0024685.1 YicC family protein [Hyphomicrobiaceae bacterium]